MNKRQILEAAFVTLVAQEGERGRATFELTDTEVDRWWAVIGLGHYQLGATYVDGIASPVLYSK